MQTLLDANEYAVAVERLRMPTLSIKDAMALTGRTSNSAFSRFCMAYRIEACARGRYRRRDIYRALEQEAR
jgi:hypothetical protein